MTWIEAEVMTLLCHVIVGCEIAYYVRKKGY